MANVSNLKKNILVRKEVKEIVAVKGVNIKLFLSNCFFYATQYLKYVLENKQKIFRSLKQCMLISVLETFLRSLELINYKMRIKI